VRGGADARLVKRLDREPKEPGHTLLPVYVEMLLQCCIDYPGLPDPRTLTMGEIRFFYSGRRGALKKDTAPRHEKKPQLTRRPRRKR